MKILFLKISTNGLGLTLELNLGLEKSGNFILSGNWQPCAKVEKGGLYCVIRTGY